MENIVKSFKIGSNYGRIGLIEYSNNPKVIFGFNKYWDEGSVTKAISGLSILGGRSFTGKNF